MLSLDDEHLRRAVERYAVGAVPQFIQRMEGGVSAEVYHLELLKPDGNSEHVVLRIHGASHSGHDAQLEFQILKALFQAGIPVPKPHSLDTSCSLLKTPYLIIAFVEGSSGLTQPISKASVETMVEALISVHDVPIGVMPKLPRRADPIPELLEFLPKDAQWDDFRGHLRRMKISNVSGPDVVLHGDFWPSNLIWSEKRIAAILDWEDAALGDPLSDVACACLELKYLHGNEGKDLFETAYAKHHKIDPQRLALWLAYVSSAALKYMGDWGLESAKEQHMRQTAHETLREASAVLL